MDIVVGLLSSPSMWCLIVFGIVKFIYEKAHKSKYIGCEQFIFRDFTMRRYCFVVLIFALSTIYFALDDSYVVVILIIAAYGLVSERKYKGKYLVTKDLSKMYKIENGVVIQ